MRYISGIHALNLNHGGATGGDWHASALRWENICTLDTANMALGSWGVLRNRLVHLPERGLASAANGEAARELVLVCANVASHERACLDMLELGRFAQVKGMRRDFICNESLTQGILEHAFELRKCNNWAQIDQFLRLEYGLDWIIFLKRAGHLEPPPQRLTEVPNVSLDNNDAAANCPASEVERLEHQAVRLAGLYLRRGNFCDLVTLAALVNNHWDALPVSSRRIVADALCAKGLDRFENALYERHLAAPHEAARAIEAYMQAYARAGLAPDAEWQQIPAKLAQATAGVCDREAGSCHTSIE